MMCISFDYGMDFWISFFLRSTNPVLIRSFPTRPKTTPRIMNFRKAKGAAKAILEMKGGERPKTTPRIINLRKAKGAASRIRV